MRGLCRRRTLESEIDRVGHDGNCLYCPSVGPVFSVAQLSELIAEALRDHFALIYPEELENGDKHVRPIVEVIASMAGVNEIVAGALRDTLASKELAGREDLASDALQNGRFDENAHYSGLTQVDDWDFHSDWYEFEKILKTKARHFSRKAEDVLRSIFGGIEKLRTVDGHPIVVDGGPGTNLTAMFRARVFQSVDGLREALKNPDKEIGPPPSLHATAGRMNARGISVFYGSTEAETALAEVRPPVGSQVVVGRFDLIRPFRLLDLRRFKAIGADEGSIFDPEYTRKLKRARFSEWLTNRMTMPVMPNDEPHDYLATQAIADFLSNTLEPPLDGIIYPSVQTHRPFLRFSGGGRLDRQYLNVVLFNSAAQVRPLSIPEKAEVSVSDSHQLYSSLDPDHLEKGDVKYSVSERLTGDEQGFLETDFYDNQSLGYDLQLDVANLEVHFVTGVTFTTKANPVLRYRHTTPEKKGEHL